MDAVDLLNKMRAERRLFDVIDLDPYGSAIPFLESSIGALMNGGLLCVTFTDMAVLCARRPHVCAYKYGSVPLPNKYCHEFALRMVLHMISQMANRHGKVIEPLMCLTVDFYIRLFIRVKDSPIKCHHSLLNYSSVYQCTDCESFYLQPLGRMLPISDKKKQAVDAKKYKKGKDEKDEEEPAEEEEKKQAEKDENRPMKVACPRITVPAECISCDGALTIGGPIWTAKMHDVTFVKRLMKLVKNQEKTKEVNLGTSKRILGILTGILDEEPLEHVPLNYDLNFIASSLRVHNPSKQQFLYALSQYGYSAVQTYYSGKLWKTDAPPEVLYDLFKRFKYHSNDDDESKVFANLKETTPGHRILKKDAVKVADISFDVDKAKENIEAEKKAGKPI